jgi:hypothetical protein
MIGMESKPPEHQRGAASAVVAGSVVIKGVLMADATTSARSRSTDTAALIGDVQVTRENEPIVTGNHRGLSKHSAYIPAPLGP